MKFFLKFISLDFWKNKKNCVIDKEKHILYTGKGYTWWQLDFGLFFHLSIRNHISLHKDELRYKVNDNIQLFLSLSVYADNLFFRKRERLSWKLAKQSFQCYYNQMRNWRITFALNGCIASFSNDTVENTIVI